MPYMAVLEIRDLERSFLAPDGSCHRVLAVPEFHLEAASQVAVEGSSGCGKTTFLHLIAGILPAGAGRIMVDGEEMTGRPESARDALRARKIGYVFQTFNLLQGLTALENVALPLAFGHGGSVADAEALLRRVGLGEHLRHRPRQLSVGQQQRVAVARALVGRPRLVLADEPTGNLDPRSSREALALIREICLETGAALLLVSHDREVLAQFETVVPFARINAAGGGDNL